MAKKLILPVLVIGVLVLVYTLFLEKYYLPVSFLIILLSFLPFLLRFERRERGAEEILLLAILASVAAVGRVPFAALPSVQPTTFVIMMTGIVFGGESGFIVGATAALVSNLFLGQGPYTPWQMFAWGLLGLLSGVLFRSPSSRRMPLLCLAGFVYGFLFGWIMDTWFVLAGFGDAESYLAAYAASTLFNLNHSICNVVFLLLFYQPFYRVLERVKVKYGLLSENRFYS